MEATGSMSIEILKGNGLVNIILDAFGENETCFTLDATRFSILCERLVKLAEKENGHDLMNFETYPNELPIEDEPPCENMN